MRLQVRAATTDWDAELLALETDAVDEDLDDGAPTDATDRDPAVDRYRVLHSRIHDALIAVLEASEGEIVILDLAGLAEGELVLGERPGSRGGCRRSSTTASSRSSMSSSASASRREGARWSPRSRPRRLGGDVERGDDDLHVDVERHDQQHLLLGRRRKPTSVRNTTWSSSPSPSSMVADVEGLVDALGVGPDGGSS